MYKTDTMPTENCNADKTFITVKNFVCMLWKKFKPSSDDINTILHYGHLRGWLEDWDENDSERFADKKTAARIIHQFMKIELDIPEIADRETYSKAEELRDLYLCRTCANHIAHVYVRGIMEAEFVEVNGELVHIFNGIRAITYAEAAEIIMRLRINVQK